MVPGSPGGLWWFLVVPGSPGDLWWFLVVPGSPGGLWWFLVVPGSPGGLWWFLLLQLFISPNRRAYIFKSFFLYTTTTLHYSG